MYLNRSIQHRNPFTDAIALNICFINSAKVDGVHKEFQKAVRAGVCRFIPETGNLLMISTDEASQKKARMIQEMHFRNLSQKVSFTLHYGRYKINTHAIILVCGKIDINHRFYLSNVLKKPLVNWNQQSFTPAPEGEYLKWEFRFLVFFC